MIVIFNIGCVHSTMLVEGEEKYPPTTRVDILLGPPSRPYKQIAILENKADNSTTAMARIREKAKEMGADAVMPIDSQTNTGVITGYGAKGSFFMTPITQTSVSMVAIKYLD